MATEADVLRSISTIMEGGLRREEAKVQTALSMMQFAQQKRMQEIALTQSNLELVSKSVQQQKPQVASEFLSSSGLAGIYQQGEEGEPAMDAIEDMAKTLRSKQYFGRKFDTNQAQSMAAAVWNYYSAEDPNAVLKLATDLHDANALANDRQLVGSMSEQQQKLYEAFANLHNEKDLSDLTQSASKARKAEAQVSKEIFDFTKGDYDISDLSGIYEGIPEALQDLDIQKEIDSQPESAQQIELEDTREALRQAEKKFSGLQKKMDTGMASDEEKEMYLKIPELIEEYRSLVGDAGDSLLKQSSSELDDLDKQIALFQDQGFARGRKYREIKRKRYEKRNEVLGLQYKKQAESERKAKFDEIEDVAGLLEVSESEAERMIKQREARSVDNIDFVDPFLF
jgi:hypothetical protein